MGLFSRHLADIDPHDPMGRISLSNQLVHLIRTERTRVVYEDLLVTPDDNEVGVDVVDGEVVGGCRTCRSSVQPFNAERAAVGREH
jgi:hypothetical protein